MNVYIISGMAAGRNVFGKIEFPKEFTIHYIDWLIPNRSETLESYSRRMARDIDSAKPFILIGYSFGGIVVQEINKFLPAKKNILLASATSPQHYARVIKLGRLLPVDKLIPARFFLTKEGLSYVFFRRIYNSRLPNLMDFLEQRDEYYLKWAIRKLIEWQPEPGQKNTVTILGDKDPLFPAHKSSDHIIKGGNHLFVYLKPGIVSDLLAAEFRKVS